MLPMETFSSSSWRTKIVHGYFVRIAAVVALALFWALPVSAESKMSEAEYLLLPDYCKAQGNVAERFFQKYYNPERTRQWQQTFGNNFQHFHHYCWSIVAIARAYKTSATRGGRDSLAKGAITDIEYVLERSSQDFVLLPEIFTKLGEAYLLARDDRNAEAAFRKAWEIKPEYWRPYVWWAQRLIQLGKTREALAVVEEGQKNAPGAKALDALSREIHSSSKAQKK